MFGGLELRAMDDDSAVNDHPTTPTVSMSLASSSDLASFCSTADQSAARKRLRDSKESIGSIGSASPTERSPSAAGSGSSRCTTLRTRSPTDVDLSPTSLGMRALRLDGAADPASPRTSQSRRERLLSRMEAHLQQQSPSPLNPHATASVPQMSSSYSSPEPATTSARIYTSPDHELERSSRVSEHAMQVSMMTVAGYRRASCPTSKVPRRIGNLTQQILAASPKGKDRIQSG